MSSAHLRQPYGRGASKIQFKRRSDNLWTLKYCSQVSSLLCTPSSGNPYVPRIDIGGRHKKAHLRPYLLKVEHKPHNGPRF